ncbi:PREDICTED: uncharacterized protein LOC109191563 [Ipomoea nil]|uniref:uncharacterized protein LOC109191563 n=1 Tax=Ipomoea nil TaxID=35883 RepID=UPI000901D04D|nr:PREDICTED: uncharacterized protein LOC109191563 [Ipomoea nil]
MEWGYLNGMLEALGFDRKWTDLLLYCVTTVRYTIQVNGVGVGSVCPTRGIRQGDPLSPYLFIICAEGLSVLLQQAEGCGDIHGIRIARGAPVVMHLFFADDSLLFFRATSGEAQSVKGCLDSYNAESGQLVNYDKSSIMFSSNTGTETREMVTACMGVRETADFGRYLGLPSVLGHNKSTTFRYIEEKVWERLGSWQHRFLSKAGKEVMLKSVAQALPIFTMSVFLLPGRLCDKIEKLFNRYWWGGGVSNGRGVHWMTWSRLSVPKCRGGLGFRRLHEFNIALLAKQGWRLLTTSHSLVRQLLKAKYFPKCEFMEASISNNPSYMWRSIMAGQSVLREVLARRIGDGKATKIWSWPWLADPSNASLITSLVDALREATVSGLMNERGQWDEEILNDLFEEADVRRIIATPIANHLPDSWRWVGDIRGAYSVKHGYKILTAVVLCIHLGSSLRGRRFEAYQFRLSSCGERAVHMAAVFWMLWTVRNDRVWGIAVIHNHILRLISTWNDAYKLAASRAYSIVKQCLSIASDIGNVVVRHVKRLANRVAHVIARATDSSSDLGVWSIVPPDCISSFLDQ